MRYKLFALFLSMAVLLFTGCNQRPDQEDLHTKKRPVAYMEWECESCNQRPDQKDLHTLNIGYSRSIDSLPLYVAMDQGFFRKEGIWVNLHVIRDAKSTIGAILHGDLDGGLLGFPQIVFALEKRVPIKVVAWAGRSHPGTRCGLHVWKYSDIHRVEDLKGKRVSMGRDVSTRTLVGTLLACHGMTLNDIEVTLGIELGEPMKTEAAFKSGRVSAIFT